MTADVHNSVVFLAAISFDLASGVWDVLLSVGIFLAIVMLLMTVFSQRGQVTMSPQREAALLMGHLDRKTVFEQPFLRPIMWLLLSMSHRLAVPRTKDWLRRTIVYAGSPKFYTAEEYLALSLFAGFGFAVMLEVFNVSVLGTFSIAVPIGGFILGLFVVLYQLYDKASKRVRLISKRVPYALDLIALAMGAGATFTEAVHTVVREESDDPFNAELTALLAEIDLGATRRQALTNLSDRIPLDMLRSIVASVIQAEELGTPLADVLHSQATLLRMQRSVRAENAAAVASVRILVPSLVIMFAVVIAVFAPMILRTVRKGLF